VQRLDWSPDGGFLAFVRGLVTEPGTMRISVVPKWGLAPATQLIPEVSGLTNDDYDIAWSRVTP
jgi:hypothetical protein